MRVQVKALAALGAVIVGAAGTAYALTQYSNRPTVGELRAPNGNVLRSTTPTLHATASHTDRLANLAVTVDGNDVGSAVSIAGTDLTFKLPKLSQGKHTVELRAKDNGVLGLGRSIARSTTLVVDTTKPKLTLAPAVSTWSKTVTIAGRSEPGARVAISWKGGSTELVVPASGSYSVSPELPSGRTLVRIAARDRAGNTTRRKQWIRHDAEAPKLGVSSLPAWQKTESPTFSVPVSDVSRVRLAVAIDGDPLLGGKLVDGTFSVQAHELFQGSHVVAFRATDSAGNVTLARKTFGVRSTNKLTNDISIGPGARGMIVRVLVRRLQSEGFWNKKAKKLPARYDKRVRAAVAAYQRKHGMPADGIARPALLHATAGKLVVYRSKFQVWVWKNGEHVATFPIAIGMPGHETPTGTYSIIEKIKNPTWIPPNSPWAQGLEPIPPGATNPLGPRWIGTSAPAIGFHGTPADASVGSPASHGCMRMHFSDVIKMYDLVEVGEPVIIKP